MTNSSMEVSISTSRKFSGKTVPTAGKKLFSRSLLVRWETLCGNWESECCRSWFLFWNAGSGLMILRRGKEFALGWRRRSSRAAETRWEAVRFYVAFKAPFPSLYVAWCGSEFNHLQRERNAFDLCDHQSLHFNRLLCHVIVLGAVVKSFSSFVFRRTRCDSTWGLL